MKCKKVNEILVSKSLDFLMKFLRTHLMQRSYSRRQAQRIYSMKSWAPNDVNLKHKQNTHQDIQNELFLLNKQTKTDFLFVSQELKQNNSPLPSSSQMTTKNKKSKYEQKVGEILKRTVTLGPFIKKRRRKIP